ncbi:hypothetical protein Tco_0451235 [Tanacetum coccineum]
MLLRPDNRDWHRRSDVGRYNRGRTTKELAMNLTKTAAAAEGATSAAYTMDEQQKTVNSEVERLKRNWKNKQFLMV